MKKRRMAEAEAWQHLLTGNPPTATLPRDTDTHTGMFELSQNLRLSYFFLSKFFPFFFFFFFIFFLSAPAAAAYGGAAPYGGASGYGGATAYASQGAAGGDSAKAGGGAQAAGGYSNVAAMSAMQQQAQVFEILSSILLLCLFFYT